MSDYNKYVGMDVHKNTIAVAIAEAGRKQPVSYGIIEKEILSAIPAVVPNKVLPSVRDMGRDDSQEVDRIVDLKVSN